MDGMPGADSAAGDVAANRELSIRVNAEYGDDHADRAWAARRHHLIFNVPERELGVLGDVRGLDVVELGCGTAYFSAWLARQGARPVGVDVPRPSSTPHDALHELYAPRGRRRSSVLPARVRRVGPQVARRGAMGSASSYPAAAGSSCRDPLNPAVQGLSPQRYTTRAEARQPWAAAGSKPSPRMTGLSPDSRCARNLADFAQAITVQTCSARMIVAIQPE